MIKRCLGKDLTTEESVKLFDSNVESFIHSLNAIVIGGNKASMNEPTTAADVPKAEDKKKTLQVEKQASLSGKGSARKRKASSIKSPMSANVD